MARAVMMMPSYPNSALACGAWPLVFLTAAVKTPVAGLENNPASQLVMMRCSVVAPTALIMSEPIMVSVPITGMSGAPRL